MNSDPHPSWRNAAEMRGTGPIQPAPERRAPHGSAICTLIALSILAWIALFLWLLHP